MIFVYRNVIALLTFPGCIMRVFTCRLICRWLGVIVYKVHYFQLEHPFGRVEHEPLPASFSTLFWVEAGPVIFNSLLGAFIAFSASLKFGLNGVRGMDIFLLWLGVSLAMQSFPTFAGAASIWKSLILTKGGIGWRLLAMPLVFLILACTAARIVLADAFYGFAVVLVAAIFIVHFVASTSWTP